jgi:hypothetical protein
MSDVGRLSEELYQHFFDLIVPLQTTKEINDTAFQAADQIGKELARLLKGQELLPRKLLYDLDMAAGILENEARHATDPDKVMAMARAVQMTYGLILCGECHDDRKPGVPRVR